MARRPLRKSTHRQVSMFLSASACGYESHLRGGAETQGWLRFTELRFKRTAPEPAADAPSSSGFAGFSRSVSGFLSSFRGRNSRTAGATSTIGIRGLTVAELESAQPDASALQWLGADTMSTEQAQQFAAAGGLSAKAVQGR